MGLILYVYRDADPNPMFPNDSTNGGLSSQFHRFTVVNADGPFKPDEDAPAVLLESHVRGCLRLVPAVEIGGEWFPLSKEGHAGPMFGGNYASTSDGRFGDACQELSGHRFYGAVAIHDRYETWSDYESLSR